MGARLIDGKALAQQVRDQLTIESAAVLAKTGIKPGLATIWSVMTPRRISM